MLERKIPSIIVQVWKDSFAEEGEQNLELTIMQKRKKKAKQTPNQNQPANPCVSHDYSCLHLESTTDLIYL